MRDDSTGETISGSSRFRLPRWNLPQLLSFLRRAILCCLLLQAVMTFLLSQSTYRYAALLQQLLYASPHSGLIKQPLQKRLGFIAQLQRKADAEVNLAHLIFLGQSVGSGLLLVFCGVYLYADRRDRRNQEKRLRDANVRLSEMVEADGLTGMKNRRALEERLGEEWERTRRYSTPLSALILDVDHFKRYNDTFGHLAGDAALKIVGNILQEQCRRNDFAARYGGEEFVVVLPHTGAEASVVAAERIRHAFLKYDSPNGVVTVSIGAATVTADMAGPPDLLRAADHALYHAKRQGRNRVVHRSRVNSVPT